MKKQRKRKSIIPVVLASAVAIAAAVVCIAALNAGNAYKWPIHNNTDGPAGTMPEVTAQPAITLPDEPEPVITTQPEEVIIPIATAEPKPADTEPVTTAETEPEPDPDPDPEETEAPEEKEYTGVVYLTFDDGPSGLTPQYLDVLKEYGVNATFFVVGVAEGDEYKFDIMKRALEEGHQIALHGSSHVYADIYQSVDTATNNFFKENRQLLDALGIDTKIIRFPGGSSNTVSKNYCKNVMTDAAKILLDNGYNYFDWNVSSSDAGSAVNSSEDICNNVLKGVKPSRTNVVLMHDGRGHQATLDALPQILEGLIEAGYEFKVITDETPSVRHNINN